MRRPGSALPPPERWATDEGADSVRLAPSPPHTDRPLCGVEGRRAGTRSGSGPRWLQGDPTPARRTAGSLAPTTPAEQQLQNVGWLLGASVGRISEYWRVAGEAAGAAGRKQARTLVLLGGVLVAVSAVVFVRSQSGWWLIRDPEQRLHAPRPWSGQSGSRSRSGRNRVRHRAVTAAWSSRPEPTFRVHRCHGRSGRISRSHRSGKPLVSAGNKAVVVALDRDTGAVQWRVRTPATQLFGVRAVTEDQLTVEGPIIYRGCGYDFVAITIDRTSGTVTEVTTLPTFFPNAESLSPGPAPLSPNEFVFEQGGRCVLLQLARGAAERADLGHLVQRRPP